MKLSGVKIKRADGTEEIVDVTIGEETPNSPDGLPADKVYWSPDGGLIVKGFIKMVCDDPQLFFENTLRGSMGNVIRFMATTPEGRLMQGVALQLGMQGFEKGKEFGCGDVTVCSDGDQNGSTIGFVGAHGDVPTRLVPGGPGWEIGSPEQPIEKIWQVWRIK